MNQGSCTGFAELFALHPAYTPNMIHQPRGRSLLHSKLLLALTRESALSLLAARASHHQELPQTRLHGEDRSKGKFSGLFNVVLSQPPIKQKSMDGSGKEG